MTRLRLRTPRRSAVLVLAALALGGCGGGSSDSQSEGSGKPSIVVTYAVLGAVVSELVGDRAEVTVVMPDGIDPHEYQPSAKDVEELTHADLVVENGLGLEEGLLGALEEARDAGVPTFAASDHVDVLTVSEGGAQDPHLWLDPIGMKETVEALAPVVGERLGIDVSGRASELEASLEELNAHCEDVLAEVPAGRRKLVTGHESMGYFARRYGFELVGAIVPSLSSQAEVSAAELADLKEKIEAEHAPAIFTELGTPTQVADAIGEEAGVQVVELATHELPEDGSYFTFVRDICDRVAGALG
jgi:zinc/manganese transport system substrate-binding protein